MSRVLPAENAGERNSRSGTGPFRRELQVHRYRILGSAADAEDMLQEAMMAAWLPRTLPE